MSLVSRTRCSVLHAAPQSRDPFAPTNAWAPDQQRITPQKGGALRSIRGTQHLHPSRRAVGWAKALFAPCPPSIEIGILKWWARHRFAHSRDPIALPTLRLTPSAISPSAHTALPARRAATSRRGAAPSRPRSAFPPRSAARVRRRRA